MVGLNVELAYGTPKHGKILNSLLERKRFSSGKMSDSIERWKLADESMRGYIKTSDADALRMAKKTNSGKVDYVTLEVPYAFAIVSSMHTYLTSVFLGRSPVYQFTARHGEGQNSVMAVEATMDYQLNAGGHLPYHYNWMWDACKYGLAVIGEYWDEEIRRVSQIEEKPIAFLGIPTGKTKKVRTITEIPGYEGNRLYNIRPYDWFPDPRLPVYDFQRGEFCGRQVQVGLSSIMELAYQQKYFNVDVLKATKGRKDELATYFAGGGFSQLETGSANVDAPYGAGQYDNMDPDMNSSSSRNFVTLLEMVVNISPAAWELGSSDRNEKWIFTVANECLIIGARPLGCLHDRFPYSILETGFGSEEFIKDSITDHIRPLTDSLTWLFNSHMYNVRKAINDVRVVDPSLIVMRDLEEPQPGGVIRLKPAAYGTDVRKAITQLQVADVTRGHLNDSQLVEQLIQRAAGVTDNVMGMVSTGGRKTATEVRSATGFSINRLKTLTEYLSALGFGPLVERMLSNTQQYMSVERKMKVAGNTAMGASSFIMTSPEAIAGGYDFATVDGTMPVDRLAQANFWKEFIGQIARVPQIAMNMNLPEMVNYVMMLQGERNVDRFKLNLNNPAQLQQSLQAGNVVPISAAGGNSGQDRGSAGTSGGTY